ncbi:hypothetical protein F7R01_02365 [Pseudomonas argentinensis]|uniref:hypothetical protein n=1 Tax=Phytopseudomonas argentinensis TaxID=289370 RepID=UPI001113A0AC|nr:hypothetical protein [Pseudomonas argentinensis]KAB0550079.1 hypothetical protein F7R01_02365 [Pseudomonas argentinensis]
MIWNSVFSIRAWSSLKSVAAQYYEVGDGLYCVGDNVFFITQPYNECFEEGLPDAPFVTSAYWAASVGAIRHCVLQELEAFEGAISIPPEELLLGSRGSYEELRVMAGASEVATYRSMDGAFVNKSISVGRFCYFFMGRDIDPYQTPYAVEVTLS